MAYKLKKPYERFERADFVCAHRNLVIVETAEYTIALEPNELLVDGEVIINPNYKQEQLDLSKQSKIEINDELRDSALLRGVTYNNILFDSDNEQKINLLAKYSLMADTDTVVWYGMYNQPLLCTKADLMAIGKLIEVLHTFCWENNAYIKEQIQNAETIEELEAIVIDYTQI